MARIVLRLLRVDFDEQADSTMEAQNTESASPDTQERDAPKTDGPSPETDARNAFLRDAALFHGKLALDGLRDLLLFPATLIAASVDVFTRSKPVGRYFYDVLHFGKETERWIDLFSAVDRAPATERPRPNLGAPSLDELVGQFERKLKAEHESGELSEAAKRALERLREAARRAMNDIE